MRLAVETGEVLAVEAPQRTHSDARRESPVDGAVH